MYAITYIYDLKDRIGSINADSLYFRSYYGA
uniref:Uncharacterized protein n=1 Tax=Cyanothece sp. (strain PCC 7425 / ATCC 29141) TaxID=395961 RepID=B8HVC4_CYAP4